MTGNGEPASVTTTWPETSLDSPPPPPGGPGGRLLGWMRRRARILVIAAAAFLTVVAAFGLWAHGQIDPSGPPGPTVVVQIPDGASTSRIAHLLVDNGVVSNALLFEVYIRVNGDGPFHAGAYELRRHESYGSVVRTLSGAALIDRLTIPEGFTLQQIADRVGAIPGHSATGFLAAARSGAVRSPYEAAGSDNLEGLLFPDTYFIPRGEGDAQILQMMVDRFDEVAGQTGLSSAPASVGVSPYQAVIVASLIEREAKVASDRPLVAEVVYNRLARGMRLQIDATVLYALGPGHTDLTTADLAVDSPYNTYRVTGLPPGPIACPGRAALEAALAPGKGPYLYYVVVSPDGKEAFSATLAGQQANIALARSRGLPG